MSVCPTRSSPKEAPIASRKNKKKTKAIQTSQTASGPNTICTIGEFFRSKSRSDTISSLLKETDRLRIVALDGESPQSLSSEQSDSARILVSWAGGRRSLIVDRRRATCRLVLAASDREDISLEDIRWVSSTSWAQHQGRRLPILVPLTLRSVQFELWIGRKQGQSYLPALAAMLKNAIEEECAEWTGVSLRIVQQIGLQNSTEHNLSSTDWFPRELRTGEAQAITDRRKTAGVRSANSPLENAVGLAFSGGGIRSATFCLGFLQSLANKGLLKHFDYLSTVSGGGYIGAFLGRLFQREPMELREALSTPADLPSGTKMDRVCAVLADTASHPIRWLRENGRYLAPNGTSHFAVLVAVLIRNWVVVQLILGLFCVSCFLAIELMRWFVADSVLRNTCGLAIFDRTTRTLQPGLLWWSPYWFVVFALLVATAVPIAWAYWFISPHQAEKQPGWRSGWPYVFAQSLASMFVVTLVGVAALWASSRFPLLPEGFVAAYAFGSAALLSVLWFVFYVGDLLIQPNSDGIGHWVLRLGSLLMLWFLFYVSPHRPSKDALVCLAGGLLLLFLARGLDSGRREAGPELAASLARAVALASSACMLAELTLWRGVWSVLSLSLLFVAAVVWLGPTTRRRGMSRFALILVTLILLVKLAAISRTTLIITITGALILLLSSFLDPQPRPKADSAPILKSKWLTEGIVAFCAGFVFLRDARPSSDFVAMAVLACLAILIPIGSRPDGWHLRQREDKSIAPGMVLRDRLSTSLAEYLLLIAAAAGLAAIDTLGQSLYAVMTAAGVEGGVLVVGGVVSTLGAALGGQRISLLFSRGAPRTIGPFSVTTIASIVAAPLAALFLLSCNIASHAIVYGGESPRGAEVSGVSVAVSPGEALMQRWQSVPPYLPAGWRAGQSLEPSSRGSGVGQKGSSSSGLAIGATDVDRVVVGLFVCGLLSLLLSATWSLANNSSQHEFYAVRLARTYLGASNRRRWAEESRGVLQLMEGDNVRLDNYRPDREGGPLHLINVTVNETVSGRTGLERRDRKGLPMCLGPCGVSVGVTHHARWAKPSRREASGLVWAQPIGPDASVDGEYRVFDTSASTGGTETVADEPRAMPAMRFAQLWLDQWVAISGAAFSTGIGSGTTLGISLTCGLLNVRMGYWWNSFVDPVRRVRQAVWTNLKVLGFNLTRQFPVAMSLLDELTSRFHGTQRQYWYLSDGGHFENMGGYELVRRRIPSIVMVDAEEDPDYKFEGLANFIRRVRVDFGADVRFYSGEEMRVLLAPALRVVMGNLEQLRRGTWSLEPVVEGGVRAENISKDMRISQLAQFVFSGNRRTLTVDQGKHSLAYAALARISYPQSQRTSLMLYIKPTLRGYEPLDILRHHRECPQFPQEPTLNQFFNEEQWECYRRLGEWIGDAIFQEVASGEGWSPNAWLQTGCTPSIS